jgi:hypothetical protein
MSTDQQANPIAAHQRATRVQRLTGLAVFLVIGGGLVLLNVLQRVHFNFGLLFWPCGFRARTGLPCLTCGMTRSVLAFSRGDLVEAFRMQPAAGLLGLVCVAAGGCGLWIAVSGTIPGFVRRFFAEFQLRRFLWQLALILLAGWVVTLAQAYRGR